MTYNSTTYLYKIEQEYSPFYCKQLELAYGKGMLSEGGESELKRLTSSFIKPNSVVLDFGSGLGGLTNYIASNYEVTTIGIDVNQWMISQSEQSKSSPLALFQVTAGDGKIEFPNNYFDHIISKGVIVQVHDFEKLLSEFYRILKPGGTIKIVDWLATSNTWGEHITHLIDLENLTLFPRSHKYYTDTLETTNLKVHSILNVGDLYQAYNDDIAYKLEQMALSAANDDIINSNELLASASGYNHISEAILNNELMVTEFTIFKDNPKNETSADYQSF